MMFLSQDKAPLLIFRTCPLYPAAQKATAIIKGRRVKGILRFPNVMSTSPFREHPLKHLLIQEKDETSMLCDKSKLKCQRLWDDKTIRSKSVWCISSTFLSLPDLFFKVRFARSEVYVCKGDHKLSKADYFQFESLSLHPYG